jgi:hypothetical protein
VVFRPDQPGNLYQQTFDISCTAGAQPPYLAYPRLVDPTSTSGSFDTAGRKPYLYFSRFNNNASAPNVELMRVQIEFDK